MTNEEWLKSLPTEEFAKHIYVNCHLHCTAEKDYENCDECIIEQLKQEHKECDT